MIETARKGTVDSAVAAGVRGQPVDGLALTRPLRDARPQPDHRRLGQVSGLRLRLGPTTCPQPLGQPSTSLRVDHTDYKPGGDFFFFFFSRAQRLCGGSRAVPAGESGRAALSLDSSPAVGQTDGFRSDHRCLDKCLVGGCPHAPQSKQRLNGFRLCGRSFWTSLALQAPNENPQNRGPPTS
jgi:hypothetical protein